MKKFIVKYTDKSGDLSSVWVSADSKEEAKRVAKMEYWEHCRYYNGDRN